MMKDGVELWTLTELAVLVVGGGGDMIV